MKDTGPVLLVHGLFGTLNIPEILERFPNGRAIAPDLLGYGSLRAVPADQISIASQVAHLRRVVQDYFGAEPVHMLGHSLGGLLVNILACSQPELVRSIVNVEGNFTLKDAFWSSTLFRMTQREVDDMLTGFQDNPGAWLENAGIRPDPEKVAVARHWLERQGGTTLRSMAEAAVRESTSEYLKVVRSVFHQQHVHLVAGERSWEDWDVPKWALENAASFTLMPNAGHLMMLEQPAEFGVTVASLVKAD